MFDLEHGEGILKLEGKKLKGIWRDGVLVEVLDEDVRESVGLCMKKIPSFSIPSEDGVLLE